MGHKETDTTEVTAAAAAAAGVFYEGETRGSLLNILSLKDLLDILGEKTLSSYTYKSLEFREEIQVRKL